jgi:hypothetical protein
MGPDEEWLMLSTRMFAPDGSFIGELSDPISIRIGPGGNLAVD